MTSDLEPAKPLNPFSALVLEDNVIIALDLEAMLRDLGAGEVITASSVAEAEAALDRAGRVDFAVLDVNLGAETSAPIAARLEAAGAAFVFATGYGETSALAARFPDRQVLTKPLAPESLRAALGRALGASPAADGRRS